MVNTTGERTTGLKITGWDTGRNVVSLLHDDMTATDDGCHWHEFFLLLAVENALSGLYRDS